MKGFILIGKKTWVKKDCITSIFDEGENGITIQCGAGNDNHADHYRSTELLESFRRRFEGVENAPE